METIASWGAPVATTIAALMTAANLGSRVTGWGFFVFLIGSVLWGILGYATGQPNLVWQNIVLAALNLFGMWRWLGRQARLEEGGEAAQAKSAEAQSETLFPASLLGRAAVTDDEGRDIARTVDAMIGCGSGRVAYLVVSTGGVAGMGEQLHRLPWAATTVAESRVRTPLAIEGLERLEKDNWPAR